MRVNLFWGREFGVCKGNWGKAMDAATQAAIGSGCSWTPVVSVQKKEVEKGSS
jgi:hypothetical protein